MEENINRSAEGVGRVDCVLIDRFVGFDYPWELIDLLVQLDFLAIGKAIETSMSEEKTNTAAENEMARRTNGERHINLIWEGTQAFVAVAVTVATLYVAGGLALKVDAKYTEAFLLLGNSFFLIVGFYFGRTNHQRVGGVTLGR